MAFRIKYARLFECRIQHGYYLHQGDRNNYFDLDPVADAALIRSLDTNYELSRLLSVHPLPQTTEALRGHRMPLATTPRGFFVGIAVDTVEQAGAEFFVPKTIPDPGRIWYFALRVSDSAWGAITEERLQPNVPAQYYFSNLEDLPADATVGLSRRPLAKQNRTYLAGERVYDAGPAQVYRTISADTANAALTDTAVWEPIPDRLEVNTADRMLLPQRFTYRFTPLAGANLTDAQIELRATDGTPLDTRNFSDPDGLSSVTLDYRPDDRRGWFDLDVTGTAGYATNQRILIDPELYQPQNWGVIAIGHQTGLAYANRLLEADNRLRHSGGLTDTPVFTIRIPNRFTYWRYTGHPSQTLNPVVASSDVSPDGDRLVTKTSKPLTRYGTQVNYRHGPTNEDLYLPNPGVTSVLPGGDGKLYSDVYLGILDL